LVGRYREDFEAMTRDRELNLDQQGGRAGEIDKEGGRVRELVGREARKGRCVSRVEGVGGKLEVGIGRPSAHL